MNESHAFLTFVHFAFFAVEKSPRPRYDECAVCIRSNCRPRNKQLWNSSIQRSGASFRFSFPFTKELVADGESFTAVFEIDDSVVDSDPDDERGEYSGAIVSSSFTFSGGYTSMVDFSGGNVVVYPDNGGGGIILRSADTNGFLLLYSSATFASDALLTTAQEVSGDGPLSWWTLSEPEGNFSTFGGVDLGQMVLSITAPTLLGDMDLSGAVDFDDIPVFVSALLGNMYQDQADCDQNGMLNFNDIPAFIEIVLDN